MMPGLAAIGSSLTPPINSRIQVGEQENTIRESPD
jgi:hypothetical protein